MKSHGKGLDTLPIYLERGGTVSCDERFKNFRNKKKVNPRIVSDDIYRYISNNSKTGLSLKQIIECFRLYKQLIYDLYMSPYAEKDMTIILPHLGYWHLNKRIGRKSGSTYKLFDNDTIVTLDKAEPSFFQIKFKVYRTLYEKIKEKTKHYE